MVGYLHQFGEPFDLAWANNGGNYLMLSMLASVRYHHSAELLATALIGGGVFARFPKFGMVMAEIGGLAWIPNMLQWIDAIAFDPTMHAMEGIQDWEHDLKPSEYAQRQLRVAPLPNEAQKASPWVEMLGDIPVFSSDYPHPEGTPDPAIPGPEAGPDFFHRDLAGFDPRCRRGSSATPSPPSSPAPATLSRGADHRSVSRIRRPAPRARTRGLHERCARGQLWSRGTSASLPR